MANRQNTSVTSMSASPQFDVIFLLAGDANAFPYTLRNLESIVRVRRICWQKKYSALNEDVNILFFCRNSPLLLDSILESKVARHLLCIL